MPIRRASVSEQLEHLNMALERNGSRQRFTGCSKENVPMLALIYQDICLELGPPVCCQVPDEDGLDSVDFDDTDVETVL